MLRRTGTTLAEVVVALALAATILATATGSLLHQQRTTATMRVTGDAAGQLRMAAALLPAHLALASASSDDLLAGELRDTAIQLRVPVAAGIACAGGVRPGIALDPDSLGTTGIASMPRSGDSLWWYVEDSLRWNGRAVLGATTRTGGCDANAPAGRALQLDVDGGDTVPAFAPLRITRQVRFVVYRSGDGTWQLGYREWNDATHSMGAPQPVAGPFLRVASDGARTGFRFYDASVAELRPDVDASAAARIARIRFTAISPASPLVTGTRATSPRDSADVVVIPRLPP